MLRTRCCKTVLSRAETEVSTVGCGDIVITCLTCPCSSLQPSDLNWCRSIMSSSALLLLLPLLPLAAAQYVCDGDSCCDWECYGNEWECCENPSALGPRSIRCWWPTAAAGFVTCEDKVKSNYDISIKCSEALQAYQSCGLDSAHACGYGLACVAQTITYAECRPLCGDTAPKSFYRSILSAGCSNDGQTGTLNTDAGVTYMLPPQRHKCHISSPVPTYGFNRENDVTVYGEYQLYCFASGFDVFVGAVREVGGVSYPVCADGINMVYMDDTGPAPQQESHVLHRADNSTFTPGDYGTATYVGNDGAPWEEKHGRRP
jgi:hypothetical protein